MFDKLKTEFAAALAISAGLLIGSGYAVTYARLANENLPTSTVLSALPQSFYLGVALENVALPAFFLLTFGVIWLYFAVYRGPAGNLPGDAFWLSFGAILAVYSWVAANLATRFSFGSDHRIYWVLTIIGLVVIPAITALLGKMSRSRLDDEVAVTKSDQLLIGATVVLTMSVLATTSFAYINARYKERALPVAAVFTDRDDCAPAPKRLAPGCPVTGLYIGESDKWLFLASHESTTSDIDLPPGVEELPGRVLVIPRDHVRQIRLDKNL